MSQIRNPRLWRAAIKARAASARHKLLMLLLAIDADRSGVTRTPVAELARLMRRGPRTVQQLLDEFREAGILAIEAGPVDDGPAFRLDVHALEALQ